MVKPTVRKGPKKVEPKVQAYDLENISKGELKKYVILLEKELATMRKDCAFFSSNKNQILKFLESRRNEQMSDKQSSVARNAKWFDSEEQLKKYPEKNNERSLIKNHEKIREQQQKVFQDFVIQCTAKTDHLDAEHELKVQITDKQNHLEFDLYQNNMILVNLKESHSNSQENMDKSYRDKLENILLQYAAKSLGAKQDFNSEKIKALISIWDLKGHEYQSGIKESYIKEMKRMQEFFNEVTTSNAEAIKKLRSTLLNLQVENKKIKFHLKQLMLENMELRVTQSTPMWTLNLATASERTSQNMKIVHSEKKIAKMQFENDILTEKLNMLKEDLQNLQKQFMSATRKIYQKAESKAFVIEEIIRLTIQMELLEEQKEVKSSVAFDAARYSERRDTLINVMNLTVEDAATLYVPPLYHEFWDPSLKLPRICDISERNLASLLFD